MEFQPLLRLDEGGGWRLTKMSPRAAEMSP